MPFVDFTHKDEYSVRNGFGNTSQIIDKLKKMNNTHYAVSNYAEVGGWIEQFFTCKKNNIIPILGMECFVNNYRVSNDGVIKVKIITPTNEIEKTVNELSYNEKTSINICYNLPLFARTLDGYYNIIKIQNEAQIKGFSDKPRTNDRMLSEHGKGIVAILNNPYSEVCSLVFNGFEKDALEKFNQYKSYFDDIYISLPIVKDEKYREINANIIRFCKKYDIKFIPVLNSHYISAEDEEVFKTMKTMQDIKTKGNRIDVDSCPEMFYRDVDEVVALWEEYQKSNDFNVLTFSKAMENLNALIDSFKLLELDTSPKMPTFEDAEKKIRFLLIEGLKKRNLFGKKEYHERMEYELSNVVGAGFTDYFLLLEDVCNWCWKNGVSVGTGRGSGCGSLLLYLLNVTQVDPLKYNLLFERFLDFSRLQDIVKKGEKVSGCFAPDTAVLMKVGLKFIKDIVVGDEVVTDDNSIKKVISIFFNGIKDVYRFVYEKDGEHYYFDATENHHVLIKRQDSILELPLNKIKKGDFFVETQNSFLKFVSMNFIDNVEVYDIEVEDRHHYRVCGKKCH